MPKLIEYTIKYNKETVDNLEKLIIELTELIDELQKQNAALVEALKKTTFYIIDELYEAKASCRTDRHITNLKELLKDCQQALALVEGDKDER